MNNKEITKKLYKKLFKQLESKQENNDFLLNINIININEMKDKIVATFSCYYTSHDENDLYDFTVEETVIIKK